METQSVKIMEATKLQRRSKACFDYYCDDLFYRIFPSSSYPCSSKARIVAQFRDMIYHYSYQCIQGVENVTEDAILEAARASYLQKGSFFNSNRLLKTSNINLSFFNSKQQFTQKIDFVVTSKPQGGSKGQQRSNSDEKSVFLYVVHFHQPSQSSSLTWSNFIERYNFKQSMQKGFRKLAIAYQTIFSYSNYSSLFSWRQSSKYLDKFYQLSIFQNPGSNQPRFLPKLVNKLKLKVKANQQQKMILLLNPSFDEIHRRQLSLNPQQHNIFNRLKPQTFKYFCSINKQREANRYFLENLICRVMASHDFKEEETWIAIKKYLDYQKKLREKYQWSDFHKYIDMNFYIYIGKDKMGRPILLNKVRNTRCSQVENFQQFYDYHIYLFEIYLQDKMEGWVDQFTVIADASEQSSENTNLSFTKRIILEAKNILVGRNYKIIAFDVGIIGLILYKILRPLLPNNIKECLRLFNDDRNELLQELRETIPDEVIPLYLGGKNPIDNNNAEL